MSELQSLIDLDKWNLKLPINIKGIEINTNTIMVGDKNTNSIMRVSAESEDDQIRFLVLRNPPLKGEDIKKIQNLLVEKGYIIEIDGVYGTQTSNAIIQFQKDRKMVSDGVVGPATRNALQSKT